MRTANILFISPRANNWIGRSCTGQVFGVFRDACNLVNEVDEVISLVTGTVGPGPFSVVMEPLDSRRRSTFELCDFVTVGSNISLSADGWNVGNLHINTNSGQIWNPVPDWNMLSNIELKPLVEQMTSQLLSSSSRESLVSPIIRQEFHDIHHKKAAAAWNQLRNGLLMDEKKEYSRASASLAGLGPGLTPAGDDFLLGVIYGMWAQSSRFSKLVIEEIVRTSCSRTNTLSRAWLRAAGQGETYHAWHELLMAIHRGSSKELSETINKILEVGHTSGADALAGFLACLSLTVEG